jgi:hypothetical protein
MLPSRLVLSVIPVQSRCWFSFLVALRVASDLALCNISSTPRMFEYLTDRDSLLYIAIQHHAHQVDALLAHHPWHPQVVVHDLVNTIKRILFVDDGVE